MPAKYRRHLSKVTEDRMILLEWSSVIQIILYQVSENSVMS